MGYSPVRYVVQTSRVLAFCRAAAKVKSCRIVLIHKKLSASTSIVSANTCMRVHVRTVQSLKMVSAGRQVGHSMQTYLVHLTSLMP